MVQVEVSNTYIDMNVNNGSEKWTLYFLYYKQQMRNYASQ